MRIKVFFNNRNINSLGITSLSWHVIRVSSNNGQFMFNLLSFDPAAINQPTVNPSNNVSETPTFSK